MKTPSGKLSPLIELAIAPQARSAPPNKLVESGDDSPARSLYAPKPPDERAAARHEDDAGDVLAAYTPKRAQSPASGAITNSDTLSIASVTLRPPDTTV